MIALLIRRARPARRKEDGAAAVEFGLITPVLVLLVFGIMSFGIIFAQTLSLNNAARQGARYGAVGSRTCAELISETQNAAKTINLTNPAQVTVVVKRGTSLATATQSAAGCATGTQRPCVGSAPGDNVYVEATFNSKLLIPLFGVGPVTVGGRGGFRCEYTL